MNQWVKWREDLAALGGWDNEMVAVSASVVRMIIEAGEAQAARLAELETWAEKAHVQGDRDLDGCASFWWDGGPNATSVQRPCNCKPWKVR